MHFLHTMLRVRDLETAVDFFVRKLGLREARRTENAAGRFGRMAFVKSPDGHSIELLQKGTALAPKEPWATMASQGEW